jgi:hypothetical protein
MLTSGSFVTSATAIRVALGWLELWARRAPHLAQLAASASMGGTDSGRAQAAFRDDLLALARECAEASWREMRRGFDDFDAMTRPREEAAARPYRPYRMKL